MQGEPSFQEQEVHIVFFERAFDMVLVLCTLAAVISAAAAASQTLFGKHPDEFIHADAVRYFMRHLWPPALNADGLQYQPDGISRVYNGELYYFVAGWVTKGVSLLAPSFFSEGAPLENLRWFQVFLYILTLGGLWYARRLGPGPRVCASGGIIALTCIPQVVYIYSYCNSDAWGVSMVMALTNYLVATPRFYERRASALAAGLLIGLVVLSKQNFWLTLPFAVLPSAIIFFSTLFARSLPRPWIAHLLTTGVVSFAVIAPLKIIYPSSQGGFDIYAQQFEAMREVRSELSFKPSNITAPGYRWHSRGIPFSRIYAWPDWHRYSLESFYAFFGYFKSGMTKRVYCGAAALLGMLSLLTVIEILRTPRNARWMIAAAPLLFGICYAASMYNSWTYDVQSQGRYLFGILPFLGLVFFGGAPLSARRPTLLTARLALITVAGACSLFLLWKHLILNPFYAT